MNEGCFQMQNWSLVCSPNASRLFHDSRMTSLAWSGGLNSVTFFRSISCRLTRRNLDGTFNAKYLLTKASMFFLITVAVHRPCEGHACMQRSRDRQLTRKAHEHLSEERGQWPPLTASDGQRRPFEWVQFSKDFDMITQRRSAMLISKRGHQVVENDAMCTLTYVCEPNPTGKTMTRAKGWLGIYQLFMKYARKIDLTLHAIERALKKGFDYSTLTASVLLSQKCLPLRGSKEV